MATVLDRVLPSWLVGQDAKTDLTLIFTFVSAVVIPVVGVSVRAWRKRHPFDMRFGNQSLQWIAENPLGERTFAKHWSASVGQQVILPIMVSTKVATVATPFDIRFVEPNWSRFMSWRNVPTSTIEILDISVPDWDQEAEAERDFIGENKVSKKSDTAGGFTVTTRKPKEWIAGKPVSFEITIKAHQPWDGYLSFEGRTDRRAFARRPFVIR